MYTRIHSLTPGESSVTVADNSSHPIAVVQTFGLKAAVYEGSVALCRRSDCGVILLLDAVLYHNSLTWRACRHERLTSSGATQLSVQQFPPLKCAIGLCSGRMDIESYAIVVHKTRKLLLRAHIHHSVLYYRCLPLRLKHERKIIQATHQENRPRRQISFA